MKRKSPELNLSESEDKKKQDSSVLSIFLFSSAPASQYAVLQISELRLNEYEGSCEDSCGRALYLPP